jgi:hypothetical protein
LRSHIHKVCLSVQHRANLSSLCLFCPNESRG